MEVADIIEGQKNKEIFVIFCEPLAEFHHNLLYCPNREECEELYEYCERQFGDQVHDLIIHGCCYFCESDEWIVVLASKGALATLLVTPEFGAELKEQLEKDKKE
ncbi:hypothetical protein DRO97_01785 [Archaeoglobales archaeon]|nr:MAG: hypothetical protein DRO97_01785 [Archaeoglobales archaeon]